MRLRLCLWGSWSSTCWPTIHCTKDDGEDEDGSEEEEDEGDHTDEEGEKVICISDDDWSTYIVNVCITNCFDIMLHSVVSMYSLGN